MPFVVNGIMMSEPVIEPWEINRSGCVLCVCVCAYVCMCVCADVCEEDYISLRWYYLLLFPSSSSSSEHQGNYANKSIRRASKKANLSQGFFSFYFFFIYWFIFFYFSLAVTVDICLNYQCNQGTCQKDRGTQPYCSCYEGYGGSRCETQIGMFIETKEEEGEKEMHIDVFEK